MTDKPKTAPLNILLVDDDAVDRLAARRALKAAGLDALVTEADSCKTAMEQLRSETFVCAFMDFQLPDGDGLNMLRDIRAEGIETPIVMLTGHGDEQIAVELMKAGASDYLSKSRLTSDSLAQILRSVIRIHTAEQNAHRAERKLRDSERLVREMADTAPALLWMSDADGNCTFFNQTWLDFTGRKMRQELGKGWEQGIHPDDDAACTAQFRQAVADAKPFRMEYRLRRADGQYRWMLDAGTPRLSPEGVLIGYIGSCIDITERRQAEQSLRENQAHIERLNKHLRVAMHETHHRVKNNLQLVAALLDMRIMDGGQAVGADKLRHLARHIHILALIHELLMQQAKVNGDATHVSVLAVLGGLMQMLQKTADGRDLTIEAVDFLLPANQATSLTIIASELITNALRCGRSCVRVSLTMRDNTATLEVRDDGPGFPPDFNPDKIMDTGLELVQTLSRLDLRGAARYENLPEGGARVLVTMPLAA